jgi:uncharacterized protein YndB with AHSA1/START domain
MTDIRTAHGNFTIERAYPQAPARVFTSFATEATKRRWFAEGENWHVNEFTVDFRVDGREMGRFRFKDGPEIRNDTLYQDIVPDRRIVFTYRMTVAGNPISVSLATVEMTPAGGGTRLTYTEQGAYFEGEAAIRDREEGCRALLEALAKELGRSV